MIVPFFPQNTLLTPFFFSTSISQSFYSPTFLAVFLLSAYLGGNNLKSVNTQHLFQADKGTLSALSTSGQWLLVPPQCPQSHGPHGLGVHRVPVSQLGTGGAAAAHTIHSASETAECFLRSQAVKSKQCHFIKSPKTQLDVADYANDVQPCACWQFAAQPWVLQCPG